MKNLKRVQKVEERIVEERKSVRTGSPRRRKATLLHFASINNRPDVARVKLLLSNISNRMLQFKLKCEPGANISALPSAKGQIDGHGSAICILTWRREKTAGSWSDAQQPKMLLILDFLGTKNKNTKRTLTRLIGKVRPGQQCEPLRPPIEQLMLDAASERSPKSSSREPGPKKPHVSGQQPEKMVDEVKPKSLVQSVTDWFNQQSNETLIVLVLLLLLFYFLGTLRSRI